MRTAPVLLRDAVALGLADPAEVLAGRTVLVPQWRSNRVHRLEGAGSVLAYVKQPGPASVLDGDDTVAVERAAWEALRGRVLLPRVLGGPDAVGGAGQGETSVVVRGDADGSTGGAVTASRGDAVTGTPGAAAGAGVRGEPVADDAPPGWTGTVVRGDAVARGVPDGEVGAVVRGDSAAHQVPGGDAVWTAPLPGVQLDRLLGDPVRLSVASTALGRELARLHAVPAAPGTGPARLPWPLHPERPLPSMAGAPEGSPAADVLAAVREPALAAALAGAARAWRRGVWVHGDLTAANVLHDGDRVGLLDWEAGGAGDPDWDVVCAAAVLHELGGAPSVQRFLASYAEAGGPGRVAAPLACVHSVVTAWQLAVQVEHLAPSGRGGEPSGRADEGSRDGLDQDVATRLGRARRLAGLSGVRP
ncbi:aminoglycoside phosphotransferase family protein [Auraticoccus monumenti]|uniref:Phosphotransferase enzyme family protein n=1 Tax=Auraticoccus monumenti TaxID=675864 RepID=A0A1G6TMS6_9ACTN|nr:aminoglycoside phosphotransferase family protein [Auraticoccus monumenti]SDD30339.1 Phosphotransferase enzyme family protein [Auraticoccus monumenti]